MNHFMLNVVWKSTERFGNLSLEKYGILKWKMCRSPERTIILLRVTAEELMTVRVDLAEMGCIIPTHI